MDSKNISKEIIKILKQNIDNLEAIYIFGSFVDNTYTNISDIDIAFLTKTILSHTQVWEISKKLSLKLKRDVDLVDLKESDTIFRFQIISKGERIFGKGLDVEKFEDLAWSFYVRFQDERRPIVEAILQDKRVLNA